MSNPYIAAQRGKFDALAANVRSITDKAAEEKRDLSDEEVRSVTEQNAAAKKLADEITLLTEAETRVKAVGEQAAKVENDVEAETRKSRTTAVDRDPGHYRKGGKNSFFSDQFKAKFNNDADANERLEQHTRGLTTSANGPGVVLPKWLVDEFQTLKYQSRALSNAVRHYEITDANTITLPKEITGTDAVVGNQASENTAPTSTDAWDSDIDTLTPATVTGAQIFSRQLLDGSSPAADQLILNNLVRVYNSQVEAKVGAAMIAAAGTPAAFATESAFVSGGMKGVIDAQVSVRANRFDNADLIVMTPFRYGEFLKLVDTTGRPIIGGEAGTPMNVQGVGEVSTDGRIRGLGVIQTSGVGAGTYPDKFLVVRAEDTILFESPLMQFRYEEVNGPQSIKVGIWAYVGVSVREGGRSTKALQVTAA